MAENTFSATVELTDREIVMAAVQQNGYALQFAPTFQTIEK